MLSLTESLPLYPLATLRLSAASALVCRGEQFWVLADDALTLQRYDVAGAWQAELQLLSGELPADPQQRKAQKPDFEALLHLPDGRLLALGSGSTAARCRACLVSGEQVQVINLQPLYQVLGAHFQALNIEGALVYQDQLLLAQRGNGRGRENALVCLELTAVLADLACGQLTAAGLQQIVPLVLPELDGVALSLTDLALSPGGVLYFSATAEDTDSSYHDGACLGSVLGRLDQQWAINQLLRLQPVVKIEGLAFQAEGRLLLVADADDPSVAAPLFSLDLPAE